MKANRTRNTLLQAGTGNLLPSVDDEHSLLHYLLHSRYERAVVSCQEADYLVGYVERSVRYVNMQSVATNPLRPISDGIEEGKLAFAFSSPFAYPCLETNCTRTRQLLKKHPTRIISQHEFERSSTPSNSARSCLNAYSRCQIRSQPFMHCKQNEETPMFTDIVPNIPQMERNRLGFNFDVHLSRQHREKPSKSNRK